MTFESKIIDNTVDKLLNGYDYREEVINTINVKFIDFSIDFFKKILKLKFENKFIDIDWYRKEFINNENIDTDEVPIYAGINKKNNYEYL